MQEAVAFAVEGKVKATVHATKMENINEVFTEMKHGEIEGRIVLDISSPEDKGVQLEEKKYKALEGVGV
jgi:propanol-preferring alcohol dehydrogenase